MGKQDNGKGFVFNIQRFSVHDGPGIRTIVFLKGCPLRCRWCCNPESQGAQPELAFDPRKCIGKDQCGLCLKCERKAIETAGAVLHVNRDKCTNCGICAEECPSGALELIGKQMSVREILDAVEKDTCFYSRSGGGLTLSGGEPLYQPDFAVELLKAAKATGMDTAIETCGHADWGHVAEASGFTGTFMYDIKCIDRNRHKEFTGLYNDRILKNFERLCREFPAIPKIVRTPVIPGFNDDPGEIEAISKFLLPFPNVQHELLPYHAFGEPKYALFGKSYGLAGTRTPDDIKMNLLRTGKR